MESSPAAPGIIPPHDPSTPVPAPANQLGRYVIAGRIAMGGMATVYLARLDAAGGFAREFALKVVHPHLADQPGFRERFAREARLASRVRHPNVATTVDAGEDEGYCYMAMELIEGGTLRQLMLQRGRGFPPAESAQILVEVARGLHALHCATDEAGTPLNVVHRDLSPHNVMLDRTGRAVLIDLGLAKADDTPALTQLGMLAGRLPYMSPEQSRQDPVDARSDVFSLGCVLCELCTGLPPFGDSHDMRTLERLQKGDLGPVVERLTDAGLPAWLSQIILLCLQPSPDDRFATSGELADALSQELTQAGYRPLETRQRLAAIVEAALPELGTLAAMHALPKRIVSDPSGPVGITGTHPAVRRRRIPPIAWALSGAAAGALLFGGVLALGDLGSEATVAERTQPSTLAPDTVPKEEPGSAAEREPPPEPEPVRTPIRRGEASELEADTELYDDVYYEELLEAATEGAPEEVTDEPAPRRRRRRVKRPKEDVPDLKPNPY